MKILVLIPNVVKKYMASFPENQNNAYKYFNYDHRIIDERAQRGDMSIPYKNADDFTDRDYDALLAFAQEKIDPILMKYSKDVACDDALLNAIRSFSNGLFDGKVNAGRYGALLGHLKEKMGSPIEAKKKDLKDEGPKPKKLNPAMLKQLDINPNKVPDINKVKRNPREEGPVIFREKGKVLLHDKKNIKATDCNNNREVSMIKNAKEITDRLDKVADEIEACDPQHGPVLALYLDKVSDVLEGKKEATTLKHDADEWFMQNRFNFDVRKREADEPFMDQYNKSDFEQVITVRKNPVPIKTASVPYQKIQ
jgi:hypothetical protein